MKGAGIDVLADVRSVPYSRRWPQFRKDALEAGLRDAGIAYVWLGVALGGRQENPDCETVRRTGRFQAALDRMLEDAAKMSVVMMCAEADPTACHRTRLIAPALSERGVTLKHILKDGRIADHVSPLRQAELF